MAIQLGRPFDLVRAERYTDPDDPAAILADVYGDFTAGGLAGPVPAIRIDKAANVYAAAAHEVGSITAVYVGPVLQGGGYTVSLANDYQSQGTIATITFGAQPTDVVTWRGTGKLSGGLLITNCIRQIADLLNVRAGFPTSILDRWSGAINIVDGYDLRAAWVVNDTRDIFEWVQEMAFNVMGQVFLRGDDAIMLYADIGQIGDLVPLTAIPPVAHIVASRDCVDGDDGVEVSGLYDHLVNALDLYYLYNWAGGNPSSRLTSTSNRQSLISQNAYGEVRKSITLRGLRRPADVNIWADALYNRQSMADRLEGTRLTFAVEGSQLAHATIGDYVGFTWAYGPVAQGGAEYRNRLVRIVGLNIDPLRGGRAQVTALDVGQAADASEDVLL